MTTDLVPYKPLPDSPTPETVARRRARGRLIVRAFVVVAFAIPLMLFAMSLDEGEAVMKAADLAARGIDTPIVPLNRWGVRFTGILAGVLVFLQLGLMARTRLVESSFDRFHLVVGHTVMGVALLVLVVVHVGVRVYGLIAYPEPVGDEDPAGVSGWESVVTFFADWPYLFAGVAAVLLVTVVLTSAVRRALPRVRWHRLHLLAYLVLAAATPHELLRGTTSTHDAASAVVARGYWVTMLALTYLVVIYYRIFLPVIRSWKYVLTVQSVTAVFRPQDRVYDVVLFSLRGADLTGLKVTAGQYVIVYPENSQHRWLTPSSYTISNTILPLGAASALNHGQQQASQQSLRLTMKVQNTDDVPREGDVVHVAGPYGHFTCDALVNASGHRKVVFLVSGMGATPMLPMVEQLARELDAHPDTEVMVIQRVRSEELRPFRARLSELEKEARTRLTYAQRDNGHPWLCMMPLLGPSTPGRHRSWLPGHIAKGGEAEVLKEWVNDVSERDVFVCGPRAWSRKVRRTLRELGVPRHQIHEERFG